MKVALCQFIGHVDKEPNILSVLRYAREAGFTGFEVLPIENDFWRFYRLAG